MAKEKISYDISVPRFLDFLNVISASYGVGTIVYHILGFSLVSGHKNNPCFGCLLVHDKKVRVRHKIKENW